MLRNITLSTLMAIIGLTLSAQKPNHLAVKLQNMTEGKSKTLDIDLFEPNGLSLKASSLNDYLSAADFLSINEKAFDFVRSENPEVLKMDLPLNKENTVKLELFRADVFTESFKVFAASDRSKAFDYKKGDYYWGIMNGDVESIVAIAMDQTQLSGFLYSKGQTYNLGKVENEDYYIFFNEASIQGESPFTCGVDNNEEEYIKDAMASQTKSMNSSNCINMYIEVDYDIFQGKGGVQQAADYVNNAFSQVAILYANEAINFRVNEIVVWDVVDPYTGPSTSNYLTQFRDNLNGVYNGDLAHLVGYQGGGGIAYVNVICNSFYGVAYSDINSSFNQVPTYSWTIEVLTHEIGHNLGSRHTHNCVWNGNNTAIDRCGPAAGYDAAPCNDSAPIPTSGTIMSYCHLLGGVGIDFNLGFGPQPGNLIRNNVYNASCLSPCSVPVDLDAGVTSISVPESVTCDAFINPEVEITNFGVLALTSMDIAYAVDNGNPVIYQWTGSLSSGSTTTVILPAFSVSNGTHSFEAYTDSPNGGLDENSSNDALTKSFTKQLIQTFYADFDNDGYGDPASSTMACTQPSGYVGNALDCAPTNGSIYPGAVCNDGDDCTTSDVYDASCNCSGTYTDSDGDGVCDANDICPGGDDTADADGDGIPDFCDCNQAQANFPVASLMHSGSGYTSTDYAFQTDDKNIVFTVSGLGAKTNGNPSTRYEDVVTILYVDGSGNNQTYGIFSGSNQSNVAVNIQGFVNSVEVRLSNGISNNNNVSVSLSVIDYCSAAPPCPDADADGVCDVDDVCPGFDDNLIGTSCDDGDACTEGDVYTVNCLCEGVYTDTDGDGVCDADDICPGGDDNADADGDGIPDFCDLDCTEQVSNFPIDPLQHSGTGSSSTSLMFASNQLDASFTISGLGSKTNGNPSARYIDQVTVTYTNASGTVVTYGTFRGDQQSSVNVDINESLSDITVELSDAYDGNAGLTLSVDLGSVTSCEASTSLVKPESIGGFMQVYPNPAYTHVNILIDVESDQADLVLTDILGRQIDMIHVSGQDSVMVDLSNKNITDGWIFVGLHVDGKRIATKKLLLVR